MGGTFKLPFVIISSMACWNTIYGCHAWGLPRVADCFPIKNGGCDPIPAIGFCHQLSNIDARLLNPWCTLWRNSVVANKKEPEKDTWRNLVTPKVFWQQCSHFSTALQYINCVGMKSRFWKSNIQNPARVIICKNRSRIIDFISHSSLALRAMWPCLMPRAESFFPWYAHHCTRRAIFFDGCPKFPYQSCRFAEERIGGTLVCLACLWEFLSLVAEVNWRPCKFSLGFHPPVWNDDPQLIRFLGSKHVTTLSESKCSPSSGSCRLKGWYGRFCERLWINDFVPQDFSTVY
jgi:putative component of membrane protein insertase Oxa1/YidC/SpoIIIJ protein YidD